MRFLDKNLAGSEKSRHICDAHLQIEGVSGLVLSRYKSSPAFFIAPQEARVSSFSESASRNRDDPCGRQLEDSILSLSDTPGQ